MIATRQKIQKRGWSLYENTMIKNLLPFDISVSVEINGDGQLEISVKADEELKGKLEKD